MADPLRRPAPTLWTRRDLLTRCGFGLLWGTLAVWGVACIRLLFPRVRYRPPSVVALGKPTDFAVGTLSDRWKKSHNFVLVRNRDGFFALRTVCTHLGCVPRWQKTESKFRCFCHGSAFGRDGQNTEGPAPRPLERLGIRLSSDGEILVDTAVRHRAERGEWDRHDAFLQFQGSASGEVAHEAT